MRLLIVLAHPDPAGYGPALARAAQAAAEAAGHEVELLDLNAEGFDPVLRAPELRGPPGPDIARHAEALERAGAVLLVCPLWWSGPPAVLKGWLDRVWRPGLAYEVDGPGGRLRPRLTGITRLGAVVTTGAPWWVWRFGLMGAGRRLTRVLAPCVAPGARHLWLAMHGVDASAAPARARFLARVAGRVPRWLEGPQGR